MSDNDLKPCPFCGHDDVTAFSRYEGWAAKCHKCTVSIIGYHTRSQAVEAWNRRPQPTPRQVAEQARAAGAEGVWLLRGAKVAGFGYLLADGEQATEMWLESPHELILLARFPTGDGGESGIEQV
jgi:Lar family restriction alleviation protein